MARQRRVRPEELTESWDDVADAPHGDQSDREDQPDSEEQDILVDEERSQPRRENMRSSRTIVGNQRDHLRKRATRASAEPEMVMPASPDASTSQKSRARTPHFRMNERSFTADAGRMSVSSQQSSRRTSQQGSQAAGSRQSSRRTSRQESQAAGSQQTSRRSSQQDRPAEESATAYARWAWKHFAWPLLSYLFDIAGLLLTAAKPIVAYAVLAYLSVAALIFMRGFLNNTINHALTPICRIPGVTSILAPSFCPMPTTQRPEGAAEFDKLVQAQEHFSDVLAASATGIDLPLGMKMSEQGVRDLKNVVQYSTLPSRNELVLEFAGFIDTARQASDDLSRYNSRIGRAVDQILSTNRWTLGVIERVESKESSQGSVSKFVANLNVFAPFQPVSLSRDILVDQYLRHTAAVEDQIVNLLTQAHELLNVLDNLDKRLDIIAGIATRDGVKLEENRDELLSSLWTKLGGNRRTAERLANQLSLLRNVGQYRRIAWAHVTSTIVKLQAIRAQLEDLRTRVATPETIDNDVPLEVHLANINLGIERLEQLRDSQRQLDAESFARARKRAEGWDERQERLQENLIGANAR